MMREIVAVLVALLIIGLSWTRATNISSNARDFVIQTNAETPSKETGDVVFEDQQVLDQDEQAPNSISDWEAAHKAAESGDLPKLRVLILDRGVHIDAEDKHSMTLLQVASRHGHLPIVGFLIEKGAAVNKTELDNRTALHFAVIRGHLPIVRFLLEKGADANARKVLGLTPLHVLAQTSHIDLLPPLLEYGADIEAPDDRGDTPLDWAITYGNRPGVMMKALLERGARLREVDADGKKPMERAARGWDVLKVELLAKRGYVVESEHVRIGRAALLYAGQKGQMSGK